MLDLKEIPEQGKYPGFIKESSKQALRVRELVKHSNIDILVNLKNQKVVSAS